MEKLAAQMRVLNQTYKEMDEIFHNYAKAVGLSDAVFGILYSLWDRGTPYPQRELCEDWCYPPQTINSALKALEKQGIVELVFAPESRKSKEIHLTAAGQALAQKVVVPFKQAENSALLGLSEYEREMMVLTLKKHLSLFRQETDRILAAKRQESAKQKN